MSEITKRAFASSLKKMLAKKPLEKIRIIDITEYCGVNRQTFYYHFKDIYDLLEWVYTNEATKALGEKKTYETWQQGFKQIFQYIVNNKEFVLTTFNSVSREYLERYLYNEVYLLLIGVVEEKAKGIPVREKDKSFIARFSKKDGKMDYAPFENEIIARQLANGFTHRRMDISRMFFRNDISGGSYFQVDHKSENGKYLVDIMSSEDIEKNIDIEKLKNEQVKDESSKQRWLDLLNRLSEDEQIIVIATLK